jgi:hypothetical protein
MLRRSTTSENRFPMCSFCMAQAAGFAGPAGGKIFFTNFG